MVQGDVGLYGKGWRVGVGLEERGLEIYQKSLECLCMLGVAGRVVTVGGC